MSTFPGSPRVVKGAIIAMDRGNPLASVTVFQYNVENMKRSLAMQGAAGQAGGGNRSEAMRLKGAPVETIDLTADIDATDQLEAGDAMARNLGIYPQLSALEMLLYPKSGTVIANAVLAAVGTIEIVPAEAPLTLFVWGVKRVLPVRLTSFKINETAYDTRLNPIQATVDLGMRVLSYSDLARSNPGYHLFLAHQVIKEVMATMSSVRDVSRLSG